MSKLKAMDIMSREVKTIQDNATLQEVAELLTSNHISGAPVVNAKGAVVGMVSESDLIDEEKRRVAIPRTAVFGLWLVPEDLLKKAYQAGLGLRARDVMSRNVLSVSENTSVDEVADIMVKRRINRVPVMRDGELVGIITRDDIVRSMITRSQ